MKIVEQTASRLVLKQRFPLPLLLFMLIWGGLFTGFPLLIFGTSVFNAGVTSLSCRRLESKQVECVSSRSYLWDLVPGTPTKIRSVSAAQIGTEAGTSDEGGEYEIYQVQLVTPEAYVGVTRFSMDWHFAHDTVTQINQFLRSSQSQLTIRQDLRWDVGETLMPMAFVSIFVIAGLVVMYGMIQATTLILDKSLNRITYRVSTLLGARQQHYPLGIVTGVALKEHIDSYGNKYYEPILLPDAIKRLTFTYIHNREEALHIQEQIREFLQLPAAPTVIASPSASTRLLSQTVYQNHNRTFTTGGLTTLPLDAPAQVQEIHRKLEQLGFVWVGDLSASYLYQAKLYTYVQPHKDVYCTLTVPEQADYLTQEFFTHFLDGTTLITTSFKLVIPHLKAQKLMRWSYPDLSITELYQNHQRHLLNLQAKVGRTQRAKTDLATVAATLDDYMTRQSSGWFSVVALLINTLAIVPMAGKQIASTQKS